MKTIYERDQQVNWHPYTQMQTASPPLAIVKGEGVWLTAEDGSKYLDAISSWWVNLHGHNHPYLMDAIRKQTQVLDHVIFSGFTHVPAVELSEALLAILPPAHEKIFYSDNGTAYITNNVCTCDLDTNKITLSGNTTYWIVASFPGTPDYFHLTLGDNLPSVGNQSHTRGCHECSIRGTSWQECRARKGMPRRYPLAHQQVSFAEYSHHPFLARTEALPR